MLQARIIVLFPGENKDSTKPLFTREHYEGEFQPVFGLRRGTANELPKLHA